MDIKNQRKENFDFQNKDKNIHINTVFHGAIRSTGLYGSGLKFLKIGSTGYIDIRLNLKFLNILKNQSL